MAKHHMLEGMERSEAERNKIADRLGLGPERSEFPTPLLRIIERLVGRIEKLEKRA